MSVNDAVKRSLNKSRAEKKVRKGVASRHERALRLVNFLKSDFGKLVDAVDAFEDIAKARVNDTELVAAVDALADAMMLISNGIEDALADPA